MPARLARRASSPTPKPPFPPQIVGRDAALLGANYADFIDAHDTVFRFAASARPGCG